MCFLIITCSYLLSEVFYDKTLSEGKWDTCSTVTSSECCFLYDGSQQVLGFLFLYYYHHRRRRCRCRCRRFIFLIFDTVPLFFCQYGEQKYELKCLLLIFINSKFKIYSISTASRPTSGHKSYQENKKYPNLTVITDDSYGIYYLWVNHPMLFTIVHSNVRLKFNLTLEWTIN